tara:strand:- start:253 stop:543 length:291 start_codon:yes stop_codon:yes gene_type:complete
MKELTKDMYQGAVGLVDDIMDDGRLFYLYDKWHVEKEQFDWHFFEFIKEAKEFIEENGLVFVKMTKGFKISMKHNDIIVHIKINKNSANVNYEGEE